MHDKVLEGRSRGLHVNVGASDQHKTRAVLPRRIVRFILLGWIVIECWLKLRGVFEIRSSTMLTEYPKWRTEENADERVQGDHQLRELSIMQFLLDDSAAF